MRQSSYISASKTFNHFLIKLLIFLVILVLLDRLIGFSLEDIFQRVRYGNHMGGSVIAMQEEKSDIYIFGPSTAVHNYVPSILEKKLGLTVYNAGIDGVNSIYQYALQGLLFEKHIPKMIIFDYSGFSIAKTADPYRSITILHPFYRSKSLFDIIKEQGPLARYKFLSKLYPYNSRLHLLIHFLLFGNPENNNKGYTPLYATMEDSPIPPPEEKDFQYDDLLEDYLIRFFKRAINNDVEIIICIPPRRRHSENIMPAGLKNLLVSNNIPIIDFRIRNYPEFKDHTLYKDKNHLNTRGAELFSDKLAEILKLH